VLPYELVKGLKGVITAQGLPYAIVHTVIKLPKGEQQAVRFHSLLREEDFEVEGYRFVDKDGVVKKRNRMERKWACRPLLGSDRETKRRSTQVKNVDYYEWKRAWTVDQRVDVERFDGDMEAGEGLHSYD